MANGLNYSYLNASIGLRLAALRAGYQPKKSPTEAENKKESNTEYRVTTTGQPPKPAMALEIKSPSVTPIRPPKKLMKIDSIIN